MKIRSLTLTLSALALAAASFAANAGIVFTNLGTGAPPASVGGHGLVPFDQGPQAAISDFTNVTAIPGGPNGTSVGLSVASSKRTVGGSWGTWSHGYTGAVYYPNGATTVTLNLPAGTEAFYVYAEPDPFSYQNITATSNTGATSGVISVTGASGANGFAFHSTAGEYITSITITADTGFAIGEVGIGGEVFPAASCASEGYTGLKLDWCRNICEKDYTGTQLKTWIRRWMDRYHDLPYCMREDEETPPQEQGAF